MIAKPLIIPIEMQKKKHYEKDGGSCSGSENDTGYNICSTGYNIANDHVDNSTCFTEKTVELNNSNDNYTDSINGSENEKNEKAQRVLGHGLKRGFGSGNVQMKKKPRSAYQVIGQVNYSNVSGRKEFDPNYSSVTSACEDGVVEVEGVRSGVKCRNVEKKLNGSGHKEFDPDYRVMTSGNEGVLVEGVGDGMECRKLEKKIDGSGQESGSKERDSNYLMMTSANEGGVIEGLRNGVECRKVEKKVNMSGHEDFDPNYSRVTSANEGGVVEGSRNGVNCKKVENKLNGSGRKELDPNYSRVTSANEGGVVEGLRNGGKCRKVEKKINDCRYKVEDFKVGDIVWAKCGRNSPWWPGIVVDPQCQAPQAVLRARVADTLCVMFYGYSRTGSRDYGWIKAGMIFPFREYFDRFRPQTNLYGSKPRDFHLAIEEAVSAEHWAADTGDKKGINCSEDEEAAGKCQDQNQIHQRKNAGSCARCGSIHPLVSLTDRGDTSSTSQFLCEHCIKLTKYCGICKKAGHHSDRGNWVNCNGCNTFVHADCSYISIEQPKELNDNAYLCLACKDRSKNDPPFLKQCETLIRSPGRKEPTELPDRISVVCAGKEGIYYPSLHLVQCLCGSCGAEKQQLSPWERHTGCRAKKWKASVKLKGTRQPLGEWLEQFCGYGCDPVKFANQQLISLLKEPYEAVHVKWTLERCAVCGWVEDWESNKIIVCNRCQMAVHEECYGAVNIQDFSWVCRACETPEIERECCLCPVKGGALKPSDIKNLWVHVTCAWSRPEVAFVNTKKMEPAVGLIKIPSTDFCKKCVICEQIHGACIKCCECETTFHAMCALRGGYQLELHCVERNGAQITKWLCYCASHRDPHSDNVLNIYTPTGVYGNRNLLQSQNSAQHLGTSLLSRTTNTPDSSTLEAAESDPFSAARCRIFNRASKKVTRQEAVCHRLMGSCYHSLAVTDRLNSHIVPEDFATVKERLKHLQKTESVRVCFGKSGIHGWGLFARRNIQEGEMIIEYRGEHVRRSVADLREAQYQLEGKDCYLFKLKEDVVIDSTNKGNIARLINHSCMPSCYARILNAGEGENRLVLVAKTNVPAGHELTYDYLFEPDERDDLKVPCLCKAPNCKKFIN